jgi:hypothetical protein
MTIHAWYRNYLFNIRTQPSRWMEAFSFWLAYRLPKRLVLCCFIRVFAYGTTGEWESEDCASVTAVTLMQRWPYEEKCVRQSE